MSGKIKGLIAGAIVLILLIGAAVALNVTKKPAADSSSSSSSEITSRLLYEKKPDDVESVVIKNQTGEYEMIRTGNEKWTIKDFNDVPLDDTMLSNIANAVAKVSSSKMVDENADDLAKYGLTNPQVDAKVTFKDSKKTVKELLIGDATPTSGFSYFAIKGENAVYAVDAASFSVLMQDKLGAVNCTVMAKPDSIEAYPKIEEMVIKRKDLSYNIKLVYNQETEDNAVAASKMKSLDLGHVMVEPIQVNLDEEKSTDIIRGMYGLAAAKAETVHPTAEQLASAGMNDPTAVISMKANGKDYKLTVGNICSNSTSAYYGYFDGVDVLYQFDASALVWLKLVPTDITSQMITSANEYKLSNVDIVTPKKTVKFELTGTDQATLAVKKDGVALDSKYFTTFYQFLLRATGESLWVEEPTTTTPDVKITFTQRDGKIQTLEFYNAGDRQSIIKLDGKPIYKCRTSYVERLLANIDLLDVKGDIVQNW